MGDVAIKRAQLALEGGFTSGALSVYNGGSPVVATRRLAVDPKVTFDSEFVWESPVEARGTYAGAYVHILHEESVKGKLAMVVYMDDLCYTLRMAVSGVPAITTLPATPLSLLAATAIAPTMSVTTQPNATSDAGAAKMLAVTLANGSTNATPVTITIVGTDVRGNALTEAVAFTDGIQTVSAVGGGVGALTCTLYTRNYFKTVNASGISTSAQPASDTVAVGGVNAFLWVFTPDMGPQQNGSTLYSATVEYFDGTATWQIPGTVANKLSLATQMGKSFKADIDVLAQKKILLTATANSINPSAQSGTFQTLQNLADNIMSGVPTFNTKFYSDPIGAVPGTTVVAARMVESKFDTDTVVKLGKAADGTPYPTFVSRGTYGDKTTLEVTLLFNNAAGGTYDPTDVNQFYLGNSRTVRAAYPGPALSCGTLNTTGGWPAALLDANGFGGYYGMLLDIAGKIEALTEKDYDGRMAFSFKIGSEVDLVTMLAPFQITCVSRVNPNMN